MHDVFQLKLDFAFLGVHKHVIMINIDNKDLSTGLTGPSEELMSEQCLKDISHILKPDGE